VTSAAPGDRGAEPPTTPLVHVATGDERWVFGMLVDHRAGKCAGVFEGRRMTLASASITIVGETRTPRS